MQQIYTLNPRPKRIANRKTCKFDKRKLAKQFEMEYWVPIWMYKQGKTTSKKIVTFLAKTFAIQTTEWHMKESGQRKKNIIYEMNRI